MSTDPYAAPKTRVTDVAEIQPEGKFNPDGFRRPAGHGWDWIKSARRLTRQHFWTWVGIFVGFAIISMVLAAIPIVGTLALYILMPILFGGLMIGCDAVYKGKAMTFDALFAGFRAHAVKLASVGMATMLIYAAIFVIVGLIFGTAVALVLSGMDQADVTDPRVAISIVLGALVLLGLSVPVYMAVWFSYALVVINDYDVIPALRTSFFGCLKNVVPFLIYGIMMLLLAIAASIPAMLGWLILGPVLFATLYTGYRDVFYET